MSKFYCGIDIGTNSVGMACTDENYNLLRAKGRDCWAVRLFEESETAVERRTARTARRRLERRKNRIKWLQGLFSPYIEDQLFFIRLNNSQYYLEDKDEILNNSKYTLFSDANYSDVDYHREFKTIYHLRKDLQENNDRDLRLYYLAIHHIVKYRGHFLFEGSLSDVRDIKRLFERLNEVCENLFEDAFIIDLEKIDDVKNKLLDKKLGKKEKQQALISILGIKDSIGKEIIKGVCGAKISPKVLFGEAFSDEKSFSLMDLNDEVFESMRQVFGDNYQLLEAMRAITNFVTFENLLSGYENISSAMIAIYDKHHIDLNKLKKFIKNNGTAKDYNKIFRSINEKNNYVNYVGYTKNDKLKKKVKRCKYENFLAFLKKYLSGLDSVKDKEELSDILLQIDNKTFLPQILHSDNGLFPYQVNEFELNKILRNMVERYPETIEIADKIRELFLYRIPYFVGPLAGVVNNKGEKTNWAVRKSNDKVTPWNIKEVIDFEKSNEAFMRRMTNKCSYLFGEDVAPKSSIVYQKFNVLNQLNKLQINGRPISVELKQNIFNQLFMKRAKVTDKAIIELLVRLGYISEMDRSDIVLSGKDGAFTSSMASYVQLKKILGEFVDKDLQNGGEVCEKIILWHTLNTDKNIVENLIRKNFGHIPEINANVKGLKGLTFKDFGRLSNTFLTQLKTVNKETGELQSILDLLYETNENLNEILFNERYDFQDLIKGFNGNKSADVTYEDVEDLYVSPAVRRGIWQTLCMCDEYVNAIGKVPDKIFVEVSREDGKKGDSGRTLSRKKYLLEKYKGIEGIEEITKELNGDDISDMKLRQERLFLYFKQLGRCMYSGEIINLDELNSNRYDVDHILPRTYLKDDSIDNKVLVTRYKNAEKSDTYPLADGFTNQREFWYTLREKGLISDKKLKLLTRTEPLTEEDFNDFINRQKVITDQTSKCVIELLKRKYPNVKIIYSKAKNISDFKSDYDLHKCRETNDLHHARDAYLNVVVGNVYDTKFSSYFAPYRKDGAVYRGYNLKTLFQKDIPSAWDSKETIKVVKRVFAKNSMAVTKYAHCYNGKFYDETVYRFGGKTISAPRKSVGPLSNTERYGGYSSLKTAYYSIVLSEDKKGRIIKTIEAVPVLIEYKARKNKNEIIKYFSSYLKNPKIKVPKIKVQQLVSVNNTPCYIAGKSDSTIILHNGVQLFTDNKTDEYVNAILKLVEMDKKGLIETRTKEEYIVKTNRLGEIKLKVTREENQKLYEYFIGKLDSGLYSGVTAFNNFKNNLQELKNTFSNLLVLEQCKVILQILKTLKCNAEISDLTLIGGTAHCGKLRINKDITEVDFKILNQSPCGLIRRERKV